MQVRQGWQGRQEGDIAEDGNFVKDGDFGQDGDFAQEDNFAEEGNFAKECNCAEKATRTEEGDCAKATLASSPKNSDAAKKATLPQRVTPTCRSPLTRSDNQASLG